VAKWLPNNEVTQEAMAQALALETDYWERHEAITKAAIVKAWNGTK